MDNKCILCGEITSNFVSDNAGGLTALCHDCNDSFVKCKCCGDMYLKEYMINGVCESCY